MAIAMPVGTPFAPTRSEFVWERNRLKCVALKPKKAIGRPVTMLRQPAGNWRRIQIRTQAVNDRRVFGNDVINGVAGNELARLIDPKIWPLRYVFTQDFWQNLGEWRRLVKGVPRLSANAGSVEQRFPDRGPRQVIAKCAQVLLVYQRAILGVRVQHRVLCCSNLFWSGQLAAS